MATNPNHYSCDACFTSSLTHADVNSIYVKTYVHDKTNYSDSFSSEETHLCKKCYDEFVNLPKHTMLGRVKDFLCRITT